MVCRFTHIFSDGGDILRRNTHLFKFSFHIVEQVKVLEDRIDFRSESKLFWIAKVITAIDELCYEVYSPTSSSNSTTWIPFDEPRSRPRQLRSRRGGR